MSSQVSLIYFQLPVNFSSGCNSSSNCLPNIDAPPRPVERDRKTCKYWILHMCEYYTSSMPFLWPIWLPGAGWYGQMLQCFWPNIWTNILTISHCDIHFLWIFNRQSACRIALRISSHISQHQNNMLICPMLCFTIFCFVFYSPF